MSDPHTPEDSASRQPAQGAESGRSPSVDPDYLPIDRADAQYDPRIAAERRGEHPQSYSARVEAQPPTGRHDAPHHPAQPPQAETAGDLEARVEAMYNIMFNDKQKQMLADANQSDAAREIIRMQGSGATGEQIFERAKRLDDEMNAATNRQWDEETKRVAEERLSEMQGQSSGEPTPDESHSQEPDTPDEPEETEEDKQAWDKEWEEKRVRLLDDAQKKAAAALEDPLDVHKQKAANDAILEHKLHHDIYDKKHGSKELENTKPWWLNAVKIGGVALLLIFYAEYLTASMIPTNKGH